MLSIGFFILCFCLSRVKYILNRIRIKVNDSIRFWKYLVRIGYIYEGVEIVFIIKKFKWKCLLNNKNDER